MDLDKNGNSDAHEDAPANLEICSRTAPTKSRPARTPSRPPAAGQFGHGAARLIRFWCGSPLADRLAMALIVVLTGLVLATFRHYGATFDEAVQDNYGHYILDWYASLGHDRNAVTYMDLYYYGGLFDTFAVLVNKISPFGHYETRHLLNGLVGVLGLVGCWRLGRRLGGPAVGLLSLVALALMPSWYGMMFINPKDIPFAATMVWGVALITEVAEHPKGASRSTVVALGIVTGLALATRIGAVLLFVYLGSVLAVQAMWRIADGWRSFLTTAARLIVRTFLPVLGISWVVMLVFWPYAQLDPIGNPIDTYLHFSERSADIATLYFGKDVGDDYHPAFYLPVYLVLKLPDVVLAGLAAAVAFGLLRLWRRNVPERWLCYLPLLLGLAVPLAYVLLTDPELYDAERHFLFLLPLLAVACALGVGALFALPLQPLGRGTIAAVLMVGAILQVEEMVRLHPYEYAFFNDLVGGVAGAAGQFETEYWGAALTEAAEKLAKRLGHDAPPGSVPVYICGEESSLAEHLPPAVRVVENWGEARFYLSTTRDHCDAEVPGRDVVTVAREGVPFAVVKEVLPALARVRTPPGG